MSIDVLYSELEQARTAWVSLYDLLVHGQYDLAGARPVLNGQSVATLHQRATLMFEGLLALRPSASNSAEESVLAGKAYEIRPALLNLFNHAQAADNQIRTHWRDGMMLRDANSNFSMQPTQADGTVVANYDSAGSFAQIDSSVTQLTNQLALLLALCRTNGVADLSQRAIAVGNVVREVDALRTQASKLVAKAEASATQVAESEKAAQSVLTQAQTAVTRLEALLQQATTDSGSITALIERIKTVGSNAETLETQINSYQSKFDTFQKELDGRNGEFLQFQENDKAAREANTKREAEIDRLTALADAMISGATTAGLSKSMEDTRARYESRMNSARIGFYVAVGLLIVSAIPLAAHLLPGLFGSWIPAFDAKAEGSPYAVIGKIVLLLPATWLTGFFTKSYADFFHLEREYAHKAALAMSVDGFKRQAEKYQEEITAEVFLEIRTNPANGRAVEPASHPLYDVLTNVVSKVLERKPDAKP